MEKLSLNAFWLHKSCIKHHQNPRSGLKHSRIFRGVVIKMTPVCHVIKLPSIYGLQNLSYLRIKPTSSLYYIRFLRLKCIYHFSPKALQSFGSPLWISQKSKKSFKFFEKNFINKKFFVCSIYKGSPKISKKSQCIWSTLPNNPRGWEKRAPFSQ